MTVSGAHKCHFTETSQELTNLRCGILSRSSSGSVSGFTSGDSTIEDRSHLAWPCRELDLTSVRLTEQIWIRELELTSTLDNVEWIFDIRTHMCRCVVF